MRQDLVTRARIPVRLQRRGAALSATPMRVLTHTSAIRSAVRDLLGDAGDHRVIAVAYVGADALDFLPVPSGLVIYCWPQAGGTNPSAVEDLVRSGAKVHFVRRLHAKVYWSRTRGALVGSANLTANALGEQALQEAAVLLPPDAFDMDSFIRTMAVEPDYAATLKQLHLAHVRFLQRNPSRTGSPTPRSALPSFLQWLATEGGADWRMGWYMDDPGPPRDAIDKLEEETGSREWATFLGQPKASYLKRDEYTLSFRIRPKGDRVRIDSLYWWCPVNFVHTEDKSWKDSPYLWFARVLLPRGAKPPFKVKEPRFRRALAAAICDMGGLNWLENASLKPTKAFLKKLWYRYESG